MKRLSGIISVVLSVCMLIGLAVPAFAANKGTADEPFTVNGTSVTGYSMASGGRFALGKTGSNLSNSYVETDTNGVSYLTSRTVTANSLVVGDKEFVLLSVDLPTSIKGSGTLTYNVPDGAQTITGVAQSGTTDVAFNSLVVVEGKTALIKGVFKDVSGKVKPVGDVTLGGTYTVVGEDSADGAKNVTVNGTAIISGYFKTLTVNSSANVSVIGDTVIGTLEQKPGSNITVNKGVKLTVDGNVLQPVEAQTITSWEKYNGYYLLPTGNYTVVSGSWELEGNTTVKGTGSDGLTAALEGNTLTVESGTVKALGGTTQNAEGTVTSQSGKVSLSTIGTGVKAYGSFKEITTTVNSVKYPITVPAGKTISAEFKDGDKPAVINSVTVKQDTVFEEWNGILPAGSNYEYENITGSWKSATTDPQTPIAVTYTGDGNSLTITSDNAAVKGTFSELNTGDHVVTVIGDLTVKKGNVKLTGTEGASLTIESGEGEITGSFKDISLKGATAQSKYDVNVTAAETLSIEEGEAAVKGVFTDITVTNSVYSITETTAETLTVVMDTLPEKANTIQGTFTKEISVTGDKYDITATGKANLTVTGGEGTIKGVFTDISVTDSVYSITETTAETLTVVMSTLPANTNTIQGVFTKEISVTGDKYDINVTGNADLTVTGGEGTIKGVFTDISVTDSVYSITETTAETLTVVMSTLPANTNTIHGVFTKEISVTGDKYDIDATGNADLTVNGGEGTIKGEFADIAVADSKFSLVSDAEATLTVDSGDGTIAGTLYKLIVKGGTVVDSGDGKIVIDRSNAPIKESAVEVMGGTLTLSNNPEIAVNSDDTTAVHVTGGTLTVKNGSIVAIGVATKAVSVSNGGELILGDPTLDDSVIPHVMTSGGDSIALYVNNKGNATVYRGDISFYDASSRGIRVTNGGHLNLYPNDEFGNDHPVWQNDPHIHIYGGKNASAAMWMDTGASFEIRGRGALIEEPNSNSDSYALYISSGADTDASILAGGTFNGKIYWDGDESESYINHLIETNHYVRFDGSNIDFSWSDGRFGISSQLDEGKISIGGFNDNFDDAESEFDGKYTDTLGKRGEYYSIIDAEHELRYAMANGLDYQIPAGIIYQVNETVGMNTDIHRYGYLYDGIELDKNDPAEWAIDKRQGDLDITGTSTIYLAGKTINYNVDYDYTNADLVSLTDGENDKLRTIALRDANSKLTIVSAIYEGEGVDQKLSSKEGGYVSLGAISFKGKFMIIGDENSSAICVENGELILTSGIITGGESGIYAKGGSVEIGTAPEDVSNNIILNYAKKQAIRVAGGSVTLNGGANLSTTDGVLVESGNLAVKGGLVVGTNQYTGSGIHTTGGTTIITGGAIYGNYNTVDGNLSAKNDESGRSIVVDGGTVTVAIDEAHQGYAEDFTRETAKLHHINNIVVNGGELNYDSAMNRNNGTLTVVGGTVNYYDGITVGDTAVYGKEHTDVDDYTTKFYVENGDFGTLKVAGYNDDNTVAYKVDSFHENIQLHGGYFTEIRTDVLLETGASTIEDILGTWKTAKYDGTTEEAKQVNHYVEAVTSARNTRGKWNRNNSIQSGTCYAGTALATADAKQAISVRNAVEELKAWAEGAGNKTYTLFTNLWIGDAVCIEEFCEAKADAPVDITRTNATLELNGLGIYGDKADTEILDVSGSAAVNGTVNGEIRNLTGNAVVVKTGGKLTLDKGTAVNGNTAVTNNGTLTVKEATVKGDTALVNNGVADVNEGASITGASKAVNNTGKLTVEAGTITGTDGDGITSSDTLTVNDGTITGKNGVVNTGTFTLKAGTITGTDGDGITSSGTLTVNDGTITGKNGVVNTGTFTLKAGTITGTNGDGVATSGAFTMDGGTVTGTADGINKTAGTATLKAGTVSSIKTDGKISEILGAGLTLSDANGVLAGADVLGRSAVKGGDNSGDEATGGDSVKYDGDVLTAVPYNTAFAANFTFAKKTFGEITIKADDKVTLTIENAKKAALDTESIKNGTASVYIDKTGSADVKVTAEEGNNIRFVKVNDKAVSNAEGKKSATVKITAKDSSVEAEGKPFEVVINKENDVTVEENGGYKYTVTGEKLQKPTVQKLNDAGSWVTCADAEITEVEGGYKIDLKIESLDSDYKINAFKIHPVAPATYDITIEETENGKLEASDESAIAGAEVELSAEPADGYIVASVTVEDKNGEEIEVRAADGKYVFTMPASEVTAKASFTKKVSRIFEDVRENDWFDPAVQYCYDNGLLLGVSEKLFAPMSPTTRGMLVTILYRLEKEPAVNVLESFSDVAGGEWYADGVAWARENYITLGYPDGTFGANRNITREQLVTLLYRYAEYKGYDVSAKKDISDFADSAAISDWSLKAFEWAYANGFVIGDRNSLLPRNNATRAEVAAIIYRFCTSEIVK